MRAKLILLICGLLPAAFLLGQAYGNAGNTRDVKDEKTYYNPYSKQQEPLYSQKQQAVFVDAPLPVNNTVELEANVMINMKVSSYLAIFSVTQQGGTLVAADSLMNRRLEIFTKAMEKAGVKYEDVHLDFVSLLPVYDIKDDGKILSNTGTEINSGFKMKKNVHVRFSDHHQLDKIISAAARANIYDLVTVEYNVSDMTAVYDSLRSEAIRVIARKRGLYDKMGFGTMIEVMGEGTDSKYPVERYDQYTAYLQGMSHREVQKENPEMRVKDAQKEQTVYYNRVPYKQFDRVLNADLVEPSVQFYYRLRVRCRLITPEEKKQAAARQASAAPATRPAAGR